MASDIRYRTIQIAREETRCRHIGYTFRLSALYAPSHTHDNKYRGLCYTSRGALAGTINIPMGPPWRIDPMIHRTMSERSYHGATARSRLYGVGHMVKDHSYSKRGNPLPPHGLLFPISTSVLLYAPSHRQDSTYHGLCYTSRGALAGTRS